VQEVEADFGLRCISLLTLADLIDILSTATTEREPLPEEHLQALRDYRAQYGIQK
jgi:orotate phosphoribosyltransferase